MAKRRVIITGMHRSGTSMMTGILGLCGLHIGRNFKERRPDNPKGHFEDRQFLDINNQILRLSGYKKSYSITKSEWKGIRRTSHIDSRIRSFLQEWKKDPLCGWKDPRICLTLPVWMPHLDPYDVKVVLMFRPAIEIGYSLHKRNKIPIELGIRSARFQLKMLHSNLKNLPWISVPYHAFFNEMWKRQELKAVLDFIGLPFPGNLKIIDQFIDRNLWHQRQGEDV